MVQKRHRQEEVATMNTEPRTATASPTPGPWRAVPEWLHDGKFHSAGRSPLVQQVDGAPIADCRRSSIYGRDEVAEANARLIAAAPTMLAELRRIVEMIEQDCAGEAKLIALRAIAEAIGAA